MITWYDRFNGRLVKQLPETIASGRYVAQDSCILNGYSNIQPGDLLVNDGTEKFHIGSQAGSFIYNANTKKLETELEIIESAILAYQEAVDLGRDSSFLIPDQLFARFELTKFEELLVDVLKKGHLQEITRRPRMELIYEERLVPVSRAKKVASSANTHLVSHSECWQTKTLTGVIPKQILALESEDQLNIYENRVYVKLLDNIEKYLVKRILEVKKLEEIFKQAVSFQNAEGIYFELRESIFTLWGEGFSDNEQPDDAAVQGIATLELLTKMLKTIKTLQNSGLYLALTHNIHVPLKLNMTNVLSHDQHYRHVARLWNSWLDTQQANNLDPEQIFQRNKKLAVAYSQYCRDLVKRTLHELGFNELTPNCFKRNGNQAIDIEVTASSEIVLKTPEHSLSFIPCFINNIDLSDSELIGNNQRILLSLDSVVEMNEKHLCTAPTNFYSLEQLAILISEWLANQVILALGSSIPKVPSALVQMLNSMNTDGYFKVENHNVTLVKPCLSIKQKLLEFKKEYKQDVSIARAVDAVTLAAERFEELLYCPCCGVKADEAQWISRGDNCFAIRNSSCNHRWEVNRQQGGTNVFVIKPDKLSESNLANKLEGYGRYLMRIKL